uniref:Prefoldin subunit 1 n=1 Tax=Panagrellus redivivus TaxID=6233 RepID=A0A7E4UR53_PANRE
MADTYDNTVKQAMAETKKATTDGKGKISTFEEFIALKKKAIFITKHMIEKIKETPDDSPVYTRMGRSYLVVSKDDEVKRLENTIVQMNADIKMLESHKFKIELDIAAKQDNMRQMIASMKKK